MGDWGRAGEAGRLALAEIPEPLPEREPGVRDAFRWAFGIKAFVALATCKAILVLDAVVSRDDRYGFAEAVRESFVKFSRSSITSATCS